MKCAEDIYHRSLALMGETPGEENQIFKERAVPIINVLLSQLFELEIALRGEKYSVETVIPQITSLKDVLSLCDPILYTVIPLGLAGFLLMEEEMERGRFFLQLYHTEVELLQARSLRGVRHKITRSV